MFNKRRNVHKLVNFVHNLATLLTCAPTDFNFSSPNIRKYCVQILFLRVLLLGNLMLLAKIAKFNTS